MFRVSSPRLRDILILSASLFSALLVVALSSWNGAWFVENGPWEMLQIGALLASCILFARASGGLNGSAGRLALGLALVSLLFLVRELPRCASPFYVAGPCMPGDTKTFAYLLPLLLWALLVVRNKCLGPQAVRWREFHCLPRFARRASPLVIVAILLLIGQFADGRSLPALEEASELAAYGLLAVAGLAAAQEADRRRTNRPALPRTDSWASVQR